MEIKKTQQAVSISKVEENERADVTKAKPVSRNDTPDSFEIGGSSTSANQSSNSASQEPEKKAGQITGGILIKQLSAARLGEPSVTRESTQPKEVDGKKDLGTDEQNRANGTDSRLEQRPDNHDDLVGNQTGNTGKAETGDNRSNRMERGAELEKLLANSGFDTSRAGGLSEGASTNSGGGGISSDSGTDSPSSPPPVTRENADDLADAMKDGPTGPGNPMDNFNERQAQRDALQNFASSRSGMMNKLNPESDEAAPTGPSKDMISSPGDDELAVMAEVVGGVGAGAGAVAVATGGAPAAILVGGLAGAAGAGLVVGHLGGKLLDKFVEGVTGGDETSLGAAAASSGEDARINQQMAEQKKATEKAIAEQKAKNAGTAGTGGTSGTSSSSGTSGTSSTSSSSGTSSTSGASGTSTNYENYVGQKVKNFKQMSNALSGMLGIDTTVHKPRIAGDKDPDPNATPESKELSGVAIVSKEFLIGQPNQEMEGGSPNVGNLDHDGGVIDNEDGSTWHGGIRTEDPGDVNTAPGQRLEQSATNKTEEDDDEDQEREDKTTSTTKTK